MHDQGKVGILPRHGSEHGYQLCAVVAQILLLSPRMPQQNHGWNVDLSKAIAQRVQISAVPAWQAEAARKMRMRAFTRTHSFSVEYDDTAFLQAHPSPLRLLLGIKLRKRFVMIVRIKNQAVAGKDDSLCAAVVLMQGIHVALVIHASG